MNDYFLCMELICRTDDLTTVAGLPIFNFDFEDIHKCVLSVVLYPFCPDMDLACEPSDVTCIFFTGGVYFNLNETLHDLTFSVGGRIFTCSTKNAEC